MIMMKPLEQPGNGNDKRNNLASDKIATKN
jgi:hypothetical protein